MFSAHGENWLHGERINSTGGGKVVLEFPVSVIPATLLWLSPWWDERPSFCLSYFGCTSGTCNPKCPDSQKENCIKLFHRLGAGCP